MFPKRPLYLCAGLLCLMLACSLARPRTLSAQTPIPPGRRAALILQAGADKTSYDHTFGSTTKLLHFDGSQPWASATAVFPGGDRWSLIMGASWASAAGDFDNPGGFQAQQGTIYGGWKQEGSTVRTSIGMIIWLK